MFTSKPLGLLTIRLANQPTETAYDSDVSIPLLEGGLIYRGLFSAHGESITVDIRASKNLLDAVRTQYVEPEEPDPRVGRRNPDVYHVIIGSNLDIDNNPSPGAPPPNSYQVRVYESIDNSQLLYGSVGESAGPGLATFSYRDVDEPITLGVLAVVVVGVGAVTCISNQVIGYLANRQCKKLETVYGFKFNFGRPRFGSDIGCHVRCIER